MGTSEQMCTPLSMTLQASRKLLRLRWQSSLLISVHFLLLRSGMLQTTGEERKY